MMGTMTLTEFLLARIAEDEVAARAMPEWSHRDYVERGIGYQHLLRHDPARVMADCEAKRQIVELLTGYAATETLDAYTDADLVLVETLRALALPYAGHPDYDEEWRP